MFSNHVQFVLIFQDDESSPDVLKSYKWNFPFLLKGLYYRANPKFSSHSPTKVMSRYKLNVYNCDAKQINNDWNQSVLRVTLFTYYHQLHFIIRLQTATNIIMSLSFMNTSMFSSCKVASSGFPIKYFLAHLSWNFPWNCCPSSVCVSISALLYGFDFLSRTTGPVSTTRR